LIKAGGSTIRPEIHKLINSIWNKEELPEDGRNRSLYLSIRRVIKQNVAIIGAYHFCQLHTKFIQHPAVKVNSVLQRKLLGIINVDSDVGQQLIISVIN